MFKKSAHEHTKRAQQAGSPLDKAGFRFAGKLISGHAGVPVLLYDMLHIVLHQPHHGGRGKIALPFRKGKETPVSGDFVEHHCTAVPDSHR